MRCRHQESRIASSIIESTKTRKDQDGQWTYALSADISKPGLRYRHNDGVSDDFAKNTSLQQLSRVTINPLEPCR